MRKNWQFSTKIGKRLKRVLHNKGIHMINKYMKNFSTSLIIRKMQIKSKFLYYYLPLEWLKLRPIKLRLGEDTEKEDTFSMYQCRTHLYIASGSGNNYFVKLFEIINYNCTSVTKKFYSC